MRGNRTFSSASLVAAAAMCCVPVVARATDVFGRGPLAGAEAAPAAAAHIPDVVVRLVQACVGVQAGMSHRMTRAVMEASQGGGWTIWLAVVAAAFSYGVLHAFGPGHGKSVIAGFLATHRAKTGHAVALGLWIATVQSCSAIALVLLGTFLLHLNGNGMMERAGQLELVSYAVLFLGGIWALWAILAKRDCCDGHAVVRLTAARARQSNGEAYLGHQVSFGSRKPRPTSAGNWVVREILVLGLAPGIRPCSGAVFVMIAAIVSGATTAGVACAVAMGLGVAVTLVGLGGASVAVNRVISVKLSRFVRGGIGLYKAIAVVGISVLVAYAAVACIALQAGWMTPTLT